MEFSERRLRKRIIVLIKEAENFKFNSQYREALCVYSKILFTLKLLIDSPLVTVTNKELYIKTLIDVTSWITNIEVHQSQKFNASIFQRPGYYHEPFLTQLTSDDDDDVPRKKKRVSECLEPSDNFKPKMKELEEMEQFEVNTDPTKVNPFKKIAKTTDDTKGNEEEKKEKDSNLNSEHYRAYQDFAKLHDIVLVDPKNKESIEIPKRIASILFNSFYFRYRDLIKISFKNSRNLDAILLEKQIYPLISSQEDEEMLPKIVMLVGSSEYDCDEASKFIATRVKRDLILVNVEKVLAEIYGDPIEIMYNCLRLTENYTECVICLNSIEVLVSNTANSQDISKIIDLIKNHIQVIKRHRDTKTLIIVATNNSELVHDEIKDLIELRINIEPNKHYLIQKVVESNTNFHLDIDEEEYDSMIVAMHEFSIDDIKDICDDVLASKVEEVTREMEATGIEKKDITYKLIDFEKAMQRLRDRNYKMD